MVITPPDINAQVGDDVQVKFNGQDYTGTIQKRTEYDLYVDFNCLCEIDSIIQSGHVTVNKQ